MRTAHNQEYAFSAAGRHAALDKMRQSPHGAANLALRPDIKARWTHGWAHAPGNPVDVLYTLGLTFSFGGQQPVDACAVVRRCLSGSPARYRLQIG